MRKYDFYDDICDIMSEASDSVEIATDETEEEIDDGEEKRKKIAKGVALGIGGAAIGAAGYAAYKHANSDD